MTTMGPATHPQLAPGGGLPARRLRVRALRPRRIVLWVLIALTGYLVAVPFVLLVFSSFRLTTEKLPWEHTSFTLGDYGQILHSSHALHIIGTTLLYAGGSIVLGVVLVVPLAFLLERTNFPVRGLLRTVTVAPLGMPPFVAASAWILLANPRTGLLNSAWHWLVGGSGDGPLNIYTVWGMIFVSGLLFVPSMYLMISGTSSRLDPALEESSATSGARGWTTARRVTLPLVVPSILGAVVFYAVVAIEIFDVPAFIGIPGKVDVLSTWIYRLVNNPGGLPDYGVASAFGLVIVVLAIVLIAAYRQVTRNANRYVTISARGYKPREIKLSRSATGGAFLLLLLYALLAFVLPFLALVWRSFVPPFAPFDLSSLHHLTLANYRGVLNDPTMRAGISHTLVIATVSSVATMTLASVTSWLGFRESSRAGGFYNLIVFANLGIPSIILALALAMLYLWLPLGIYGTVWIIVIALVTRYLAYGTLVMTPAFFQVSRDLEDASATAGASAARTFASIVLPLVFISYLRGVLWTFIQAARDVTIVLILLTVSNVTVGAELFSLWSNGDYALGSAGAVLLTLLTSVLTFIFIRLDPARRQSSA